MCDPARSVGGGTRVYLNADGQLDAILARVERAGASVLLATTAIGPEGFIAFVRDSEGNEVGFRREREELPAQLGEAWARWHVTCSNRGVVEGNIESTLRFTSRTNCDVVVVGAGIAGLCAARRLARAGARVTVLEGRGRPGGRILTERPGASHTPVELGAEFVHGTASELHALIEEAGLELEPVEGEHFEFDAGELRPAKILADVLGEIGHAGPNDAGSALDLASSRRFGPEQARWLSHFVEGFHAAPLDRVSARSIVRQASGTDTQARCRQGYGALIDFLSAELVNAGASLAFGSPVRSVAVTPGGVVVRDPWREHVAGACIVALPLPMHQAPPELGGVALDPAPDDVPLAAQRFESGLALRVTFRLTEPAEFQRELPHGSFVHVLDEDFPTWWSGSDLHEPKLVAWCGGPRCARVAGERRASTAALAVLSRITGKTLPELRALVREVHVHDFGVDRFSRGAYPYELAAEPAVELPITAGRPPLMIAGDFFDADEVGTVAAAVKSGHAAASALLGAAPGLLD